ncbi:S-layer homology domain-containing protein [Planococcus sp. NCCP-2050]|uniref:S-layer homology domain-containing protein n=1 Tax=Planococcus sp. NCCP-2050 TaxID=2944679 RepID=UPI00203F8D49|nr:S-layer homology domain-containing protein [Planococcus sp. NCCP-2050]GKW44970.1 hypothetical protein NCCP2050_06620 [Planococcus sp. NCCP-2050]
MFKIIAKGFMVFLLLGFILPSHSLAATPSFKDVSSFKAEIEYLTGKEIIFGFQDGTFRPNEPILRIQAVQMLMREIQPEMEAIPNPGFKDIKPGERGYEDVAKAVALGIISGKGNQTFDPRGKLTRAEMAIILSRAYELGGIYPKGFKDVSQSSKAYWHISAMAANNITVGYPDGTFRPSQTIDRAQFAAFMTRVIEPSFQPDNPSVADTLLEALVEITVLDYVADPVEPILYLLDGNTNEVVSFNYDTYEMDSVKLSLPIERLAMAGGKLYLTQSKGKHSPYWFEKEQQGAYAIVDADSMVLEKTINIDIDPYDIEADSNGFVYITPGSGQFAPMVGYNGATGEVISLQQVRAASFMDMHPAENKIYTITTDTSPRNISAFAIADGEIKGEVYSPYHGTYPMEKDILLSPDGKFIFNSTGHVFRSSATDSADMVYHGKLDRPYNSIAFDMEFGEVYTSNKKNYIQAYDYKTLKSLGQLESYGAIDHLIYNEQEKVLVILSKVKLGDSTVNFTGIEKVYFEAEE